ncbi:MAG: ATP-binding protein, partial [Cyanobacteria bacterium]|nr:ATP-binding protein [Cyanobacteriota bacterium]
MIAAPRGHAKTTFKVLFKAIHAIVYGYESFILIIGHSAPEAESKVKDILDELQNNSLLHSVFGYLAPIRGHAGWSTKNFVTQNGIRVMAKSRGKQVRGLKHVNARPSLIILDDIESPSKVLSEEQRYRTKEWFEKDILKLGSIDGTANIMIIGTCLHPEALLPDLLRSPGWKGNKYQAILSFSQQEPLWQDWKVIYTDLSNPHREKDASQFFHDNKNEMLENTKVLWPEAEPYEQLMKIILNEGQASFQSEKQNDPYDPERQIFDMSKAKRFKMAYAQNGEWVGFRWLDGSDRFISSSDIYKFTAFHDPALCEGKESDFAAIVVCAVDVSGYIY